MFAILFGLSTDYNVFLLSRVREEWGRHADHRAAIAAASAGTRRIISAAGAIMVAVFLGFATDPDPVIKMTGVGLATAVLVDVTLVRLLMAPGRAHAARRPALARAAAPPGPRASRSTRHDAARGGAPHDGGGQTPSWATTTTARSCAPSPSGSRPSSRRATDARRTAVLRDAVTVVIALGSIGLGVLVGAAADGLGETGATAATIVAWVAIALINVVARARRCGDGRRQVPLVVVAAAAHEPGERGDAAAQHEARDGRADQDLLAVLVDLLAPVGDLGHLGAQAVDGHAELGAVGLDRAADLLRRARPGHQRLPSDGAGAGAWRAPTGPTASPAGEAVSVPLISWASSIASCGRGRRALLDQPHGDQAGDQPEQEDQHAGDQEAGPQGGR